MEASEFFGLGLDSARAIIREVPQTTRTWREVAREVGAARSEMTRMVSAFDHEGLDAALQL